MARARLLIVDDDTDMLHALSQCCRSQGFEVDYADGAAEAIGRLSGCAYDIVLLDLAMPGLSGVQLLGVLKEIQPSAQVIIHTAHPSMDSAIATLREGRAFDYLVKPASVEDLTGALDRALVRRRKRLEAKPELHTGVNPELGLTSLTPAERDVARLLTEGLGTREIGQRLGLAEGTVRNRISIIFQKIGAAHRVQAVVMLKDVDL